MAIDLTVVPTKEEEVPVAPAEAPTVAEPAVEEDPEVVEEGNG